MTLYQPPGRRRLNTVREVIEDFLARGYTASRGAVLKDSRYVLLGFITAKGDVKIEDLIADDLEKWIEEHKAWESDWTRMRVAATVKRAFSWAWKKGLIDRHPFVGVNYRPGNRGQPMSDEHFRMLLRNTTPEFRRVLLFLSWTGCRPCEMAALTWDKIDVERRVAVLHAHKTMRTRKDRAPRIICLPEKVIKLLAWLIDDQRDDQPHVFVNARGLPWSSRALGVRVQRLRDRLGIPNNVRLYGCRHQFATKMCLAGTELKTVATLLGHTTARMAEHYTHIAGQTDHLLNAVEKGLAHKPENRKP